MLIGGELRGKNQITGERMIAVNKNVVIEPWTAITAFDSEDMIKDGDKEKIIIGAQSIIGPNSLISAINRIEIGEGLRTRSRVLISDNTHGDSRNKEHLKMHPDLRPLVSKGPIVIGKNVWLGNSVAVLGGVSIGDGAIIGANSVVTHDIPPYSVAVGAPAKIIQRTK